MPVGYFGPLTNHSLSLSLPTGFLSSIHSQTEDQALALLLTHLPLLHPGNTDARKEYMRLLPKVLLGSSETHMYLEQCCQLLSLALVHPAFPPEDRDALTFWLNKLDGKHKPGAATPRQIVSLPINSSPSLAPATPPSSSSSSSSASPHKKIRQIKNDESSSALGNGDLMIEGYIGPVSNGFDVACDPTPPPPSSHYMHTLEEMDKRVTLPPNLTAHEVLQLGKYKSTTLPARTAHYNLAAASMGDDLPSLEWNVGMKGSAFSPCFLLFLQVFWCADTPRVLPTSVLVVARHLASTVSTVGVTINCYTHHLLVYSSIQHGRSCYFTLRTFRAGICTVGRCFLRAVCVPQQMCPVVYCLSKHN